MSDKRNIHQETKRFILVLVLTFVVAWFWVILLNYLLKTVA